MGVIFKKEVEEDCHLGIWEITEDYDTLLSNVNLDESELLTVKGFCNQNRKLEWLSVRSLLSNMINDNKIKIIYNEQHKPFLADGSYRISISHSKNLTSVLLSKKKRVGIDLEYMSHKIKDISFKFINENEHIENGTADHRKFHLYIHWCAKEALYKICDKQNINFKENLFIEPFDLKDEGSIIGLVCNELVNEKINMNFFRLDNYVIVWCCK
jgi:4'-phosphopantetheinyl transferase